MIRIGPIGWTDPGLVPLWPAVETSERPAGDFDPLAFLGRYFGCIEADAPYYAPPRREHVARWRASLMDAPRSRLCLRLPREALDFDRPPAERHESVRAAAAAFAPLVGREQLGALVAQLPPHVLFGPSETRELLTLARLCPRAPLVLEAEHPSWTEAPALDALRGAGWALATLDATLDPNAAERLAQRPSRPPSTGAVDMLRIRVARSPNASELDALVRRVRSMRGDARYVLLGVDESCAPATARADAAKSAIVTALMLKRALVPLDRPVLAWSEVQRYAPAALAALRHDA